MKGPKTDAVKRQSNKQGVIRNHIMLQLGTIRFDKLTAARIARHYHDFEDHGRRGECGKGQPLPANSVHKVHVVLGAFLDAGIDDGHLTVNAARRSRQEPRR